MKMEDKLKAQLFTSLLSEFDKISNEIASIKGEDLDLNTEQESKIRQLMIRQEQIKQQVSRLY